MCKVKWVSNHKISEMSISASRRIEVKNSGQKSKVVMVLDANKIEVGSKETDGWKIGNRGNSVGWVMWPRTRDYGLGALVLDTDGSLVTVKWKYVSLKWYRNGAKTVFQKFGRLWCLQRKTCPPGRRPVPA